MRRMLVGIAVAISVIAAIAWSSGNETPAMAHRVDALERQILKLQRRPVVRERREQVVIPAQRSNSVIVICKRGLVVGGGFRASSAVLVQQDSSGLLPLNAPPVYPPGSPPPTPVRNAWTVAAFNPSKSDVTIVGEALCFER